MTLFHLFTVTPVDVAAHELPRVQYLDYYIRAQNIECALLEIKGDDLPHCVAQAAEVFGAQVSDTRKVILNPATSLNRQETVTQHCHWAQVQDRYQLLHQGPESLDQWSARRSSERHPEFA